MRRFLLLFTSIVFLFISTGCKSKRNKINESGEGSMGIYLSLSDTVPYLNQNEEDYFIGNGIAGGGGNGSGEWNFLIGPDYTSPTFLESEILKILLNEEEKALILNMHRIRGTGMFYGFTKIDSVFVHVIDFAIIGQPLTGRYLFLENKSINKIFSVKVKTEIRKRVDIRSSLVCNNSALLLHADTSAQLFGNGDGGNWKDRYALISFNDTTSAFVSGSGTDLITNNIVILPGAIKQTCLYHYLFEGKVTSPDQFLEDIQNRNIEADLFNTSLEWGKWLSKGKKPDISDRRVKDILESMLVGIKMQQNRCGGFIAGVRKYAFSYIRDSHGACRGLLAYGYTEEVKRFLDITNQKYNVFKYIPDAVQMGNDKFTHGDGNQFAESPAYVLLLARDYFLSTKDFEFLITIQDMLTYCIDIQINKAKEFNWLLPFNGDETEQYCMKEDGQEYGGFPALSEFNKNDWSMPSVAGCIASLEFYIDYLKMRKMGDKIEKYQVALNNMKDSLEKCFYRNDIGFIDWAKKRNNTWYPYRVTNFELMPLWFGASLINESEKTAVIKMIQLIDPETGFLPNAPGNVDGFCGNSLGYLLYDLTSLNESHKDIVYNTLINSNIIQRYGMVNEFYGPGGIPNLHNFRCFESGIVLEAIIKYLEN